ncbi:MAG TPA: hypothetical protein VGA42_09630 [Gemmatimonadales bacterium]
MFGRQLWTLAGAAAALGLTSCTESSTNPLDEGPRPNLSQSQTGNGAPSGPHFTLNIIGVEKGHENDNSNSNGRRIFVPLGKNGTAACDIFLHEGDYDVTDYNCLDSDRDADFWLPNPDDGSGFLVYSVWVRALGGPTGSASLRTCFTEFATATTWCNAGDLIVSLSKVTPPKFVDVSKQLLQVCALVGTNLELVPIFSPLGTDYFWHYENTGLRLAQLRFYPISTTEIGGACTRAPHTPH